MSSATETTPTPVLETLFNTGNLYTPQGQRIVAVQFSDGTVSFEDLDRWMSGTITGQSGYDGADTGAFAVYETLDAAMLERIVRKNYVTGHNYTMGTMEREDTMSALAKGYREV